MQRAPTSSIRSSTSRRTIDLSAIDANPNLAGDQAFTFISARDFIL
jgi:hypothetical protein